MRIKPINPYSRLLQDRKYHPKVTKNKKKYDRKREQYNDRLSKNNERDRS